MFHWSMDDLFYKTINIEFFIAIMITRPERRPSSALAGIQVKPFL